MPQYIDFLYVKTVVIDDTVATEPTPLSEAVFSTPKTSNEFPRITQIDNVDLLAN